MLQAGEAKAVEDRFELDVADELGVALSQGRGGCGSTRECGQSSLTISHSAAWLTH